MIKHTCYICGEEFNENDMVSIFTGRLHWRCWKCYKKGQYEAGKNEIRRIVAISREMKAKGIK